MKYSLAERLTQLFMAIVCISALVVVGYSVAAVVVGYVVVTGVEGGQEVPPVLTMVLGFLLFMIFCVWPFYLTRPVAAEFFSSSAKRWLLVARLVVALSFPSFCLLAWAATIELPGHRATWARAWIIGYLLAFTAISVVSRFLPWLRWARSSSSSSPPPAPAAKPID